MVNSNGAHSIVGEGIPEWGINVGAQLLVGRSNVFLITEEE
jgi:hypothetical protein